MVELTDPTAAHRWPATAKTGVSSAISLAWLLDPVSPATFVADHWERAPLFVSRSSPGHYACLPGLNEVDELITATASRSPGMTEDVRIIRTDEKGELSVRPPRMLENGLPDIQAMYRDYQHGCSLSVNHLHRRSASLARLCGRLEEDLHHPIGVNLYLTPRGSQGFQPHIDTHDVFILQVHGTKDWYYAEPDDALPLPSMKPPCHHRLDRYRKITMRPGDLLYLPRGFPHFAKATATSSLHYTVGLEPYRWIDFMYDALQEMAHSDVAYRHALPPGFSDRPVDGASPRAFAGELVRQLQDDGFLARVGQRLEARRLRPGKATPIGHFASIDAAQNLAAESVLVRVPGVHCRVRRTEDAAIIDFTGNFVSGPDFLMPLLQFIAENRAFAVKDLPGTLAMADKLDLIRRLIGEGLLHIIPTR